MYNCTVNLCVLQQLVWKIAAFFRSVLIHLRKGLPTTLERLKDGVPTEVLGTSRLEAKIDEIQSWSCLKLFEAVWSYVESQASWIMLNLIYAI